MSKAKIVIYAAILAISFTAPLLLNAQGPNFHVSDIDFKNPVTIRAAMDHAQLLTHTFTANPQNQGGVHLGMPFFKGILAKRYPLQDGTTLSIRTVGNLGPLVPALIIATGMSEVEKSEADDGKLQSVWLEKQTSLLSAMNSPLPKTILDGDPVQAWRQFLIEWTTAAQSKEGGLRKGLQEAPFAFLSAMLEEVEGQKAAAENPGTSSSRQGSNANANSATSSGHPRHERIMNRIFRHHDRKMNRADAIRARR